MDFERRKMVNRWSFCLIGIYVCMYIYIYIYVICILYMYVHYCELWFKDMYIMRSSSPEVSHTLPMEVLLPRRYDLTCYPRVIKHGNRKYSIYSWFSYQHFHLQGIFQPCLMKPEGKYQAERILHMFDAENLPRSNGCLFSRPGV